jgi:ADP-heptose:LPS heptosyltransferase
LDSTSHTKRAVIFISAGLGDAILLVPLAKKLKQQGFEITGMVTSAFPCEELFEDGSVFDRIIDARSKAKLALLALKEYRFYQLAILNYFASSRTNLLVAQKIATMVHTNRIPDRAGKKMAEGLVYFEPQTGIHDSEQNMLLAGLGKIGLTEDLIRLSSPPPANFQLPERFIVLQISAGNNTITYKNWPVSYWISFLNQCARQYPDLQFVMLGDSGEKGLANQILDANTGNVQSLCGATTVSQAFSVIGRCSLFLGLDGGLMHTAAALGKPSFTLWGPSNPILYGYQNMNPERHKVISLNLSCAPCSAWIAPNTSRFSAAENCPDIKCMKDLNPDFVFGEFSTFVKQHALV